MADHSSHDWMENAVKHPGALTEKAKRAHESLSQFESEHHTGATARQVALAKAFKKANHNRGK